MSIAASSIAMSPVAASTDGAVAAVRKPPPKRTLTALADPSLAPEPR